MGTIALISVALLFIKKENSTDGQPLRLSYPVSSQLRVAVMRPEAELRQRMFERVEFSELSPRFPEFEERMIEWGFREKSAPCAELVPALGRS